MKDNFILEFLTDNIIMNKKMKIPPDLLRFTKLVRFFFFLHTEYEG